MKYDVSDQVQIVSVPVKSMHHPGYFEWLGKTMTIRKAFNNPETCGDYYYMEERIDWTWHNDMIEKVV